MRAVAAFDFDGTLSRRDSLVPFLRRLCGDPRVLGAILSRLPVLVAAGAGRVPRGRAKEALLRPLIGGRRLADVEPVAEEFARRLLGTGMWGPGVERLGWHRARGDEVVIVSASPELYLAHVGRALGVRAVLATGLEVDAAGRLTGRLRGDNVRGAEKVARLDAWLGGDAAEVWAYGDSDGDRQLLARADHGFVRRGRGFTPIR
ncbi:MAG TPA: HAD-IB family hydrolase [Candidatus Dormibacteraeota bacterium]